MEDGTDTALARRLLAAGVVDPAILRGCLGEVRAGRPRDPELTLAGLLLSRRLVAPARLGELMGVSSSGASPSRELERGALPASFGAFSVVRELDRGGMGAALEVRDAEGQTRVLKTILPGLADEETLARFTREAELTARLDHPHVVRIHAADLRHDPPYLVLDYLPGGNLQERLEREGRLALDEVLILGQKLCAALEHAHARGILHRDLKPQNVLFDDRGEPRVIDWGLARSVGDMSRELTRTGALMGTPAYMAPEQALDASQVGPPADVYSLGALLFALARGEPPFAPGAIFEVLDRVLHEVPSPLSRGLGLEAELARAVDELFARVLAKEPAARPGLEALRLRLRQLERGELGASAAPPRRGRRLALGAGVSLCLILGLALGARAWRQRRALENYAAHLAWEAEVLEPGLYGLSVAPIPSAAELAQAAARLDQAADLDDPRLALSRGRLQAYQGLLDEAAEVGSGASGRLVEGRRALAQGSLGRAAAYAQDALRLAEAAPERRAAALLAIAAAASPAALETLGERLPGEGAALRQRAAELLLEGLAGFPAPGEAWAVGAGKLEPRARLAERLGVAPAVWAAGFERALPAWGRALGAIQEVDQADALALALEGLQPPTLGAGLRRLLAEFVSARARTCDASLERGGAGADRELEQALLVEDTLSWLAPEHVTDPALVRLARAGRIAYDRSRGRISALVGLFLLRVGSEARISELSGHFEPRTLEELLRRRPHPDSQARAFARLLATSGGRAGEREDRAGDLDQELQELAAAFARPRRDLSPQVESHLKLLQGQAYSRRAERGAEQGLAAAAEDYASARACVETALSLGFAPRLSSQLKEQCVDVIVAAERSRGRLDLALLAAERGVAELRRDLEEGSKVYAAGRRLGLAWSLHRLGEVLIEAERWSEAQGVGRELVELMERRPEVGETVAQGRYIMGRALVGEGRAEEAWRALAVEEGTLGLSAEAARLILELARALGHQAEAQAALDKAFRQAYPSDPIWKEQTSLRLTERERERVGRGARRLGYTIPADAYRR